MEYMVHFKGKLKTFQALLTQSLTVISLVANTFVYLKGNKKSD